MFWGTIEKEKKSINYWEGWWPVVKLILWYIKYTIN